MGKTVTLEVETAGDPPTEVKWYRGGLAIKEDARVKCIKVSDHKYQLVISNAERDDEAKYKARATKAITSTTFCSVQVTLSNDGGTQDSTASLTVKQPPPPKPTFLKGLDDRTVDLGADVAMEIETNCKPKTVKWYKNGREIRPTTHVKAEKVADTKYRLEISGAEADDQAVYKVQNNA